MQAVSCFQGERPTENIRYLVNRNLDELVKVAISDATLFQSTSQAKSSALNQLKYTLLLGENNITKHTQTILKALVRISHLAPDIPEAHQKIQQIVSVMGSFVQPSYYIPLVTNILGQEQYKQSNKNTIVLLNILAQMVNSTPKLQEYAQTFVSLLTHYEKMFYDTDEGLVALFQISSILLRKLDSISNQMLHVIFNITINVQATRSISEATRKQAPGVFVLLAQKGGFASVPELNASEIGPNLEAMVKNKEYIQWNKTSKNRFKFDMIIRNCSSEVSRYLPHIMTVLQFLLNPQSDLQVRIDTLVLIEYMIAVPQLKDSLSQVGYELLKKVLMLAIQWKVGKPQIKIRKAGVINMINLIDRGIINQEQLLSSFSDLVPHLKNCLSDDWAPELRLASCELLQKYLMATKQKISDDQLRQLYPILLQRLDDSQNPIRLKITAAINVFFSCRYIKLSQSTFDYMINAIFVHFDDTAEDIRSAIYLNLKHAAFVDPKSVLKQAKVNLQRMNHKDNCKELIEYCEERIQEFQA